MADATNGQTVDAQVKPAMTPPAQATAQGGLQPTAPTPTPLPTSQPSLAAAAPSVAPPATPGVASATALPATQSFGPGNDLRGTQINPTTDPRLAATQGNVDTAANKLATGPDRFQLAQSQFKTYADQTDPAFQASIRAATQKAAANGAVGSGQLGTDYGNLALQHTRDLGNERDTLFNSALGGTIADNQANVGLLSGLENQQYGEGSANRGELRGERDYQNGMENQAYQRGVQGLQLGDQLTNSAFGRGLAQSQFGATGNPAGTELGLAGMYGQQASDAGSSLAGLMQGSASNGLLSSIYGPQKQATTGSQTPQYSPNNGLMSAIYGDD